MTFPNKLSQLCTPSYVYFIISVLAIAIAAVQNIGNSNKYTLGMFSCFITFCYVVCYSWLCNDASKKKQKRRYVSQQVVQR